MAEKQPVNAFADRHAAIAKKQITVAQEFRRRRLIVIQKNEDLYFGKTNLALKERMNVPLPMMPGFVDSLLAKIDDPPKIHFDSIENVRAAKKNTAAWQKDSSAALGKWAMKDLGVKFLAILSGRGIYKYYASRDPNYKSNLEVVDYYDFLCEPNGGGDLDNHMFQGQENIFKTKHDLIAGAKSGAYNGVMVQRLLNFASSNDFKEVENQYEEKQNRMKVLGLDPESNNFVGQQIYSMVEWVMVSPENGKKYYMLLEPRSGLWVRFQELKEVFSIDKGPWVSFATHYDPFNFWSQGPADIVRPIAESMNIIFNQYLENRQRRNFVTRAYDPEVFPDPSKLKFKADGLVRVKLPSGKSIANSIYEFKVDEIEGNIDLLAYLNSFVGEKTGITPGSQGVAERDKKVGIFFGELQQVADRLGLHNKFYTQAWAELGHRYQWGLYDHLREPFSVKFLGTEGAEIDDIRKEDAEPEFEVIVSGGAAEDELKAAKSQSRLVILRDLQSNPVLFAQTNKKWLQEMLMKTGEVFSEEEIKMAMDVDNYGSQENLSRAAQAIQEIMLGKKPKLYRGATTGFMQYIVNYATDKELPIEKYKTLMDYASAHVDIVMSNMMRRGRMIQMRNLENQMANGGMVPTPGPIAPVAKTEVSAPIPNETGR